MITTPTKQQQYRALGLSTFAVTLCFAVWTIFSIIGIRISEDLGLSDTQLGLLMATPILTGAISQFFLGIWTERFGGRWVFGIVMLTSAACVYLLTFTSTYGMLLVGALGVGLAGGAFIVGVTYTTAWFEPARQGTALGIFGAAHVGAAVTSFGAPFLLVALGWEQTARIYAMVLAIMGVAFMVLAREDPLASVRAGENAKSFMAQMEPLRQLRIWRFALYYFFVFGAFVALALWLPHYLIGVYGLDIKSAGMIAALYTVPASLFHILGSWMSDRYGARRVMYWALIASAIGTFLLSYPPTDYVVHSLEGDLHFTLEMSLPMFVALIFILGFFMSLGKAAVYKHIPVYYPAHVGAVGGAVGMIGGLGGFLLPLMFGVLNDITGIWQSSFMLMFVIVAAALAWMHYAIRSAEKAEWTAQETKTDLPELASPYLFYPLNRSSEGFVDGQMKNRGDLHQRQN